MSAYKVPAGVQVAAAPHNPECWLLPIAGRTVCWRFWPAIEGGKRLHEAFVTLEGWPHGPVSADDMDRLAGAAAAVADRIRTDRQLAIDRPTLFDPRGELTSGHPQAR